MHVREAVEEYSCAILVHSPATQVWYLSRLKAFVSWCETTEHLQLEDIKATTLRKYIHHLATTISETTGKQLSSYTVHGHARTLRTFLKWCAMEDGIEHLVAIKTSQRMTMPRIDQKVIEIFTQKQIAALFAACDKEYAPHIVMRDKAIITLLLDTGIRAQELVTLTLDNVHLDSQDAYIKVMGKGRKEREVGLGKSARVSLLKYINRYRNATHTVPGTEQHVFLSRFNRALTVNGLDQLFIRLGEWAQVEGVRCSPHTFRHTFAVEYLKNGGDIFKLSRLMGHASVQITTDVYLNAFRARDARAGGISIVDLMKLN